VTFDELLDKLNGLGYEGESYLDILWDAEIDESEYAHHELYDQRRWSTTHRYVYEYQERFFELFVDRGSTEYQDDDNQVEAREVQRVKKTVYDYIPIPKILPVPLDASPPPVPE
jgi:hypothetical protein